MTMTVPTMAITAVEAYCHPTNKRSVFNMEMMHPVDWPYHFANIDANIIIIDCGDYHFIV